MRNLSIQVENISKQYHIGELQQRSDRFTEQLTDLVLSPVRRAGKLLRGQATGAAGLDEKIWALNGVSFDIKQGEVVGIIGRNGAGKSTLLKILSRITEPTKGFAEIHGRVGSLLEVGTGFHPELTGRENVFLNGAILGMKKSEIERKFDEIVSFAEIDAFIDTPVKHYSSGMYVRLAFSVAAHLEPEILLVDEVLAVGDIAFQRKCLGKMDNVAQQGRTILFVSHNMSLIQTLCQRGILLQQGKVRIDSSIDKTVDIYIRSLEQLITQDLEKRTDRRGRGLIKLVNVNISGDDSSSSILKSGGYARFTFHLNGMISNASCVFIIYNHLGQRITEFKSDVPGPEDISVSNLKSSFICEIDELMLVPGRYRLNVLIRGGGEWQDHVEAAAIFDVETGQLRGRPVRSDISSDISVCMPHHWSLPTQN